MNDASQLFDQAFAYRIAFALLHFVWQGIAVSILLGLFLTFFRNRSKGANETESPTNSNLRYIGCCAAMLTMAALPLCNFFVFEPTDRSTAVSNSDVTVAFDQLLVLESPTNVGTIPLLRQGPDNRIHDSEGLPIGPRFRFADIETSNAASAVEQTSSSEHNTDKKSSTLFLSTQSANWIVAIWFIGVVGFALWHCLGWRNSRRFHQEGTAASDRVSHTVKKLKSRLGITVDITVRTVTSNVTPITAGFFKPIIVLPASIFSNLTTLEIEAILAHEVAHIKRHDYLVNLIQSAIETLLFYHPAVWWVSRQIRVEREYCADEMAIRVCAGREVYAQSLLTLAENVHASRTHAIAATGGTLSRGTLSDRIRCALRIESDHSPAHRTCRSVAVGAFSLLGLVATIVGAQNIAPENELNSGPTQPVVNATNDNEEKDEKSIKKTLTTAVDPTKFGDHPEVQIDAMLTVARARHKAGKTSEASRLLKAAEKVALTISETEPGINGFPGPWNQSGKMFAVCIATASTEGTDAALQRTELVAAPHLKAYLLCHIAKLQHDGGDKDSALKNLRDANEIARTVEDIPEEFVKYFLHKSANRTGALEEVAKTSARLGNYTEALDIVDELNAMKLEHNDGWDTLLQVLSILIVEDNEMGIITASARMVDIKDDRYDPPLSIGEAYIMAANALLESGKIDRANEILNKQAKTDYADDLKFQLDSLRVRIFMARLNAGQDGVEPSPKEDFLFEKSFEIQNALHARWLARQTGMSQREQARKKLQMALASVMAWNEKDISRAQVMTFVAHGYAILDEYETAFKIIESMEGAASAYVNPEDMEHYGLPYQPLVGKETTYAIIAREQLSKGSIADARRTIESVKVGLKADGTAKSWYSEKVKATSLAEIASALSKAGEIEKANELIAKAETDAIKAAIRAAIASRE